MKRLNSLSWWLKYKKIQYKLTKFSLSKFRKSQNDDFVQTKKLVKIFFWIAESFFFSNWIFFDIFSPSLIDKCVCCTENSFWLIWDILCRTKNFFTLSTCRILKIKYHQYLQQVFSLYFFLLLLIGQFSKSVLCLYPLLC